MAGSMYPARTLDGAYGALELRLNLPGLFKSLYVERPARCVDDLGTALCLHDPAAPVKRLFTGHGGSGKTTELFRLLNLEVVQRSFQPVYYSVMADYGIPDVQLVDVLLTMALQIIQQVDPRAAKGKLVRGWLKSLATDAEKADIRECAIGLSNALKLEVGWRQEVRTKLAPRVAEVVDVIDALALQVQQKTKKRLLVVVDDLEKTDLTAALDVFCKNPYQLAAPSCDTIFTVPLSLIYSEHCARVTNHFGQPVVLPTIAVSRRDGTDHADGIDLLLRILHRRAAPDLFEDGVAEALAANSGGVVFDLLDTARQGVLRALSSGSEKVTRAIAEDAIKDLSRSYWRRVDSGYYDTLVRVAVERHMDPDETNLALLHMLAVLEYEDDPTWHDVHPALKRVLEAQGRIAKDERGQWCDTRETKR